MKRKKIGFLGGSFDPIHFGHIHLGISLQEKHGFDEVIVCPSFRSPFKNVLPESGMHRLSMVQLAIENIASWSILDWEVRREAPSYTIDTIKYLMTTKFSKEEAELFLLMGFDVGKDFFTWKEVDALCALATPVIGSRIERSEHRVAQHDADLSDKGAIFTPISFFEISATEVRDRIQKKMYCGHLVPAKVLDYIAHYQLYLPH